MATDLKKNPIDIQELKKASLHYVKSDQKQELLETLKKLKQHTNNKDYSEHVTNVLKSAYENQSKTVLNHYCKHENFQALQQSRICKRP